ncbi:hypothetical protein PR202_gb07029 [Eleusine coracana subsp. coracana]|uniref:MATH domain-containing protein n=1 Tax=Eleusine coracana subsp. coracana TaxID=191504 RepID=A0AAV5E8N9_ELECO|nr:hypothetical protein PR202_gb07029 [Eleusine coracana subsp. coracana]
MLFVDHYWDRKKQVLSGSCIEYPYSFKAGDYFWSIHYYPNGLSFSSAHHESIYVVLRSRVAKPVRASVTFTLKADIEASEHLVNGRITIRCDVSVEGETPLCGLHDFLTPTDVTFRVAGLTFRAHPAIQILYFFIDGSRECSICLEPISSLRLTIC